MTFLEGCKEAMRRDGSTSAEIENAFRKVAFACALPWPSGEEIPAGEEEAFIARQLFINLKVKELIKSDPSFNSRMEAMLSRKTKSN